MISFEHARNFPLYLLAVERGLRVASTLDRRLKVSSSRRPGLPLEKWYDVFVTDGFYSCACQEPYPKAKACSHGSIASVAVFPSLLTGWLLTECQRIREEWRLTEYKGLRDSRDKIKRELLADIRKLDAGIVKGFAGDEVWRERYSELLEVAA